MALLGVDRAGFSTELAPEPSAEPFAELALEPSAELPAAGSVFFLHALVQGPKAMWMKQAFTRSWQMPVTRCVTTSVVVRIAVWLS